MAKLMIFLNKMSGLTNSLNMTGANSRITHASKYSLITSYLETGGGRGGLGFESEEVTYRIKP
jgi:hypothetical protein